MTMTKTKRTVIYARVSTLDQTPENQLIALREYVSINPQLELVDVYEDRVSGAKDSRPELNRLMEDARKKKFDHVVFWKVDRLGRNAIHTQTVANEWKKLGISFTITTLGIDTSTPAGTFLFGIMAQFAEMERNLIIERTNLGLNRVKKNLDTKGYHTTNEGRKIKKLGRPKGSKDKKKRRKSGYYRRWAGKV
jgi:DNA invertase Pin-like site-specific DNA recombinase